MAQKMILLALSMLLILSCQVWQNTWGTTGRTGGFSAMTITDTISPIVTKIPGSAPTKVGTPALDPLSATAQFMQDQPTQSAADANTKGQENSSIATSRASVKNAQATVNAINITATARVNNANSNTTEEVNNADLTATAKANSGHATEVAPYLKIDPNELYTYPNKHINESVVVSGRVFFVISKTDFLIWLDGVSYEAVYISMVNPYSDIFENDDVNVYGIVAGEACGTNTSGGESCRPQIIGVFYEKK